MIIALNKPYGVLSQFTQDHPGQRTLAEFGLPDDVYPVGRLDLDSEGLLLLSNEKGFIDKLLNPRYGHKRSYMAQVEGIPDERALDDLRRGGIVIKGHRTARCNVRIVKEEPAFPPRVPPIRHRENIPTTWIQLELTEGKNRQVRRMTAAVGYPTLRLIRVFIGEYGLGAMKPGEWRVLSEQEKKSIFATTEAKRRR